MKELLLNREKERRGEELEQVVRNSRVNECVRR